MQDLGTLGGLESEATGVSADGSVVVGWAYDASGQQHAFRWTDQTDMEDLDPFSRWDRSVAYGVSADGSVVVGEGRGGAFRWTAQSGMQNLNQLYAALLQGSILRVALAISSDGRYIVGSGFNLARGPEEAFLLDTQGISSVEDGSKDEVTIVISPQPVAGQGWVQVRLGRLEQARVEVRDVLGRLVTVLGEGVLGEQRLQLPRLAPGMYTVVVRSGQGAAARQFVVTR